MHADYVFHPWILQDKDNFVLPVYIGPGLRLVDYSSDTSSHLAIGARAADGIHLPAGLSLEEAERRYARAMLDREGGNQSAAARALGISRNKLARLLRG